MTVHASPETCFALWSDYAMMTKFVPGMEKAELKPDGKSAECLLFYQFADQRTHPLEELRFMATVAEREENALIHYQSTDGFPCGAVIAFEAGKPDEDGGATAGLYNFNPVDPWLERRLVSTLEPMK
jgi:hypothetical protein